MILNSIAACFPDYYCFRLLGIRVYIDNPGQQIRQNSIKLLIESFFDMAIAVLLNIYAFSAGGEFKIFFTGAMNIVNSVMTIIWSLLMILILLYSHFVVHMFYDD